MSDERIEREVMRGALLEALRREPKTQYVALKGEVAQVLMERGLPVHEQAHGYRPVLWSRDERRFREIIWELINQHVLVQGINESNGDWPWLSVTEWGEEYIAAGGSDVYDPDGYLRNLDADHPLDAVERRYLGQALAAFRADLPDASAVMLGAAAEHLLLTLAEAIVAKDPAGSTKVAKALSSSALKLLNEVHKYLEQRRKSLARNLSEGFNTTFLSVADVIRTSRNDAGHPALAQVDRDQAFVVLRLFPAYRRWVNGVISALPL